MKKNTKLYTDQKGYELFLAGKPFVVTAEKKEGDYTVTVPVGNLVEFPLEDELEVYDVISQSDVTVVKEV